MNGWMDGWIVDVERSKCAFRAKQQETKTQYY